MSKLQVHLSREMLPSARRNLPHLRFTLLLLYQGHLSQLSCPSLWHTSAVYSTLYRLDSCFSFFSFLFLSFFDESLEKRRDSVFNPFFSFCFIFNQQKGPVLLQPCPLLPAVNVNRQQQHNGNNMKNARRQLSGGANETDGSVLPSYQPQEVDLDDDAIMV